MVLPKGFDPDAAAGDASGIYGLPFTPDEASVVIIPVPFEATTSYGGGTSGGPRAVFEASKQVDLSDFDTGRPYEAGIAMLAISKKIERWSREAKELAGPIIEAGGARSKKDRRNLERVNEISEQMNRWVKDTATAYLSQGKMVAVLGGDHSVPFGAIEAHAELYPGMGILHLDAHADLRDAYEGFTWSHASIFHNVVHRIKGVRKLVQVGLRDVGKAELDLIKASGNRITAVFDSTIASMKDQGRPFQQIADEIMAALPETVYLSWDIDGLDPTLCPSTGTPVPGGLSWNEAISLLRALVRAKKRIVGLDLCEVAPGKTEWDANVGARLLYKMIGFALMGSRR